MKNRFSIRIALCVLLAAALLSSAAVAQDDAPEATRLYNAAAGMHNAEAYELAAEQWAEFLDDYKQDSRAAKATYYLGVCYSKTDQLKQAVDTFEKLVKDFPEFELLGDTYLNLGLTQYNMAFAGKPELYDAAATTFATLAAKFPEGPHAPDATFYRAECLYHRGKKKEAVGQYAQVVQKYPEDKLAARSQFALGVAQTELGQHAEALATYKAFLEKYPQHPQAAEATMWRGESLFALKQYAKAVKAYTASAAVEGFKMADYATVRQADALAAMKQFAQAAAVYASVPTKFSGSKYVALCQLEAGKKYFTAGDFAKSRPLLQQIVDAAGPSTAEAAHWIARGLLKEKQPAEALAAVEKALATATEGPFAVELLMDQADAIYEIPQRRGEAVGLYAALAAKHPADPIAPQALYMAAFAAMNQRDYPTATKQAQAFAKAYPKHELSIGVKHVAAESKLLGGQFAMAEKLYDELLAAASDDSDAEIWKVHRGTALHLQKKYAAAIAALQPVVGEIKNPELLAEAWYRIGRSQVALKQFAPAVASLEASLKAGPKWKLADDAHLVLAYAAQQTQDHAKARQHARQVVDEFPQSRLLDLAHYRLGESARLGGDLDAAAAEYQLIAKTWPQSRLISQSLYGLGWAQLGRKDHAAAETAFDALLQNHPQSKLIARARYGRGMARRQLKKFAPAAEDLQAFLASKPSSAERSRARHVLGMCQKGLKQFDQAVATFETLLKEDPDYTEAADALYELGWAQKSLKKEAKAAATFALLVEKHPDSTLAADSHYLIGDFAFEQKKYDQAVAAYQAAMTKAGKTQLGEEAAYKLALSYYLSGDLDKAQQAFRNQRATWPEGTLTDDAAFMEAECFFKQHKYKEALAAYATVKNPSNPEAKVQSLLHAGIAAGQLDQFNESLKLLGQCVEQFPDSPHVPQALYEQGWAQQNLGNLDEAVAIYRQVLTKSDAEPAARAQFMIGEVQFEQKQHAEAVKSFFKVIFGYGYPQWQANATYEAARCFEVLGKKSQAVKQYQTLIEKYPQSDKVPLAKQRLEKLQ